MTAAPALAHHTPCDNEQYVYEGGDDLLFDQSGIVWIGIDKGDQAAGTPAPGQSVGACFGSDLLDMGGTASADKGDVQVAGKTNPFDTTDCVVGSLGVCVLHETTVTTGDDGDNTGIVHVDLYGAPTGNGSYDFVGAPDLCLVNIGTPCP